MPNISTYTDPAAIAQLDGPPSASALKPDLVARQAPDRHLVVPGDGRACAARCSLWWTDTPAYADDTVGLVGHYAAADAAAGRTVLDQACRQLADAGCTCAIGPMDGATWYSYRFVTARGDRPPFALEPWHPAAYPEHFRAAGFEPLARYVSAVGADREALRATPRPDGCPVDDVRARSLDRSRFEDELRRLHPLVTTSFAENLLYTPLSEADFVALYRPYRSVVAPELVHLLEQERAEGRRLVGFAFMIPNVVQAERGEDIDTAVLKTLAVHPDVRGQGLGRWLTTRAHAAAAGRGYRQVLHALMHEDNVSRRLGHGPPVRRYTLFHRPLS